MSADMRSEKTPAGKRLILVFPAKSSFLEAMLSRVQSSGILSLFILAALTPKDYRVKFHHQRLFWPRRDFVGGALVGISCNTSNVSEGYKIADRFRKAGSTVIMGGMHVSHLPQEALQHCDSVVIGEAESVWPQLVRDFENGTLQRVYHGVPLDDWFSGSYEYFLSLPPKELRKMGFLLGRGCKYRCEFCVPFFGNPRFMKLEQVVGFVSRVMAVSTSLDRKRGITFFDDNIFSDSDCAKRLFTALIPMGLKWAGSCSLDIAFDEEALRLAKASGCYFLFMGFETISPKNFPKTSVRGINTSEDYIRTIKKIQSYGIMVRGGFVLGFDDCTHKYCFELLKFLLRSGLDFVDISILTPFPGSQLFERFKQENRIVTYDWRKFNPVGLSVFKPRHMSRWALYGWMMLLTIAGLVSGSSWPWRAFKGLVVVYVGLVGLWCICYACFLMALDLYLLFWWAVLWVLRAI